MFTSKFYLTIAIAFCCYKKCSKFLWHFDGNSLSSVVYFQDKNYVYLFPWCPFSSLKLLIGFRLNALFSGSVKIFYASIRASSLLQKRSSTVAVWLIYIGNYTFPNAIMSVFRTKLYVQHLHSSFWLLTSYKRRLSNLRAPSLISVSLLNTAFYTKLQTCQLFNSSTSFDFFDSTPIPLLKMARHNNVKIYNVFYRKNVLFAAIPVNVG